VNENAAIAVEFAWLLVVAGIATAMFAAIVELTKRFDRRQHDSDACIRRRADADDALAVSGELLERILSYKERRGREPRAIG
jgi:uncharacterized membrane protein